MTWRDELRQASFRGQAFHVASSEAGFGRRQIDHEYPGRDSVWTEDNGRVADEFTIDAYLVGPDYKTARDALIVACRDIAGPGTLVHPYYGELQVNCRGIRVRETNRDGGYAQISITFREAGEQTLPSVQADASASTNVQREAVIAAAIADFEEVFTVDGLPGFVTESATSKIASIVAGFQNNPLITGAETAADFIYAASRLVTDAATLARTPSKLATRIANMVQLARLSVVRAERAMLSLYDDNKDEVPLIYSTSTRRQEKQNLDALSNLTRQLVLAESSQAGVDANYESTQQAYSSRDALAERIDAEAEAGASDDVYTALMALRAEIVNGIPRDGQTLPYVIQFTPPTTLPSLVIAQQLYGDASRADEIVERNRVRHPGFVPGGTALQVLSDG